MSDKEFWRTINGWTLFRSFVCLGEILNLVKKFDAKSTTDIVLLVDVVTAVFAIASCFIIIHAHIKRTLHYVCIASMITNLLVIGVIEVGLLYGEFILHKPLIWGCVMFMLFFVFYSRVILLVSRIK
jgi:hypothetical protein